MRRASSLDIWRVSRPMHLENYLEGRWREGGDALEFTWRRCTAPPPFRSSSDDVSAAPVPRICERFSASLLQIQRFPGFFHLSAVNCDLRSKNQKRDPRESFFTILVVEKISSNERIISIKIFLFLSPRNVLVLSLSLPTSKIENCSWTRIKSISSESRWRPSTGNRESRTVARTGTERGTLGYPRLVVGNVTRSPHRQGLSRAIFLPRARKTFT